jgi:hypothetical protein
MKIEPVNFDRLDFLVILMLSMILYFFLRINFLNSTHDSIHEHTKS